MSRRASSCVVVDQLVKNLREGNSDALWEIALAGFGADRSKAWVALAEFYKAEQDAQPKVVVTLSADEKEEIYQTIELDIDRTFVPNHNNHSNQKNDTNANPPTTSHDTPANHSRLRHIVRTLCTTTWEHGYTQGINFLAAMLLVRVDDASGLVLLRRLCCDVLVDHFTRNMIGNHVDQRVLYKLIEQRFPEVYAHLQSLDFIIQLVTTNWFICLFQGVLRDDVCENIWDAILIHGIEVVFSVSLALFALAQKDILDCENSGEVLRCIQTQILSLTDPRAVLLLASSPKFRVSSADVTLLRVEARQEIDREIAEMGHRRDMMELHNQTEFSFETLERLHTEFLLICKPTNEDSTADNKPLQVISEEQFTTVIRKVVGEKAKTGMLFRAFDENGDGVIDFRELMIGFAILSKCDVRSSVEFCFRAFDVDRSGTLERTELLAMLDTLFSQAFSKPPSQTSTRGMVDRLFAHFDTNHDNTLSLDEFHNAVRTNPSIIHCFVQSTLVRKSHSFLGSALEEPNLRANDIAIAPDTPSMSSVANQEGDADGRRFWSASRSASKLSGAAARPRWKHGDNSGNSKCAVCARTFARVFPRLHHCRNCGECVCARCSLFSDIPRLAYLQPVRVCAPCYVIVVKQSALANSQRGNGRFSRDDRNSEDDNAAL